VDVGQNEMVKKIINALTDVYCGGKLTSLESKGAWFEP
jgi:hypothetical protein